MRCALIVGLICFFIARNSPLERAYYLGLQKNVETFFFFFLETTDDADCLAIALLHRLVYGPGFCTILRFFELAFVLVRLDHVARVVVNANHS